MYMYVFSGIEIPFCLWTWPCWEARTRAVRTRAAAALATRPVTTPVYGISNTGHILPNYAGSLK